MKISRPGLSKKQIREEKQRVYAPTREKGDMEWKEFNAAVCRIMQNYCGELKNRQLLEIAGIGLEQLARNEAPRLIADNPHKLVRTLEVLNILTCSEMIVLASKARKASSAYLQFLRQDYPALDPPGWRKHLVLRQEEGRVVVRKIALDFWKPLAGNYDRHARDK